MDRVWSDMLIMQEGSPELLALRRPVFVSVIFFTGTFDCFPDHPEDFVPVKSDLGDGYAPFFRQGGKGDLLFAAGVIDQQGLIYICQSAGEGSADFAEAKDFFRFVFGEGVEGGNAEAFFLFQFAVAVVVHQSFQA